MQDEDLKYCSLRIANRLENKTILLLGYVIFVQVIEKNFVRFPVEVMDCTIVLLQNKV